MVSVIQVYNALRDLSNKEQKGFITPVVFNSFASIAQMNIYNEIFSELVNSKRLSRQNFDPGGDVSQRKQKREDLAIYSRREILTISEFDENETQSAASNIQKDIFNKPSDLSKIISISAQDTIGSTTAAESITPCEIVYNPSDLDRLAFSNLSSPTNMFPVAYVTEKQIQVFPEDACDQIEITYYAKPTSYNADGSRSSGSPFYDVITTDFNGNDLEIPTSSSRDFMLPPHYLNEVVMELAKLIGIRLRDPNVSAFAAKEEASE